MIKKNIVCNLCDKVGHMTSKCRDLPRKGVFNAFSTNKKRPKKIWAPKNNIIHVTYVLDSSKNTLIMVHWYLDSRCSRHMIGERCMFQCMTSCHGGTVTFRSNKKG